MIPLPVTVTVTDRGVTIESPRRVVAMNMFSERAKRLALDFGVGTHTITTQTDVEDIPTHTLDDLAEAIA